MLNFWIFNFLKLTTTFPGVSLVQDLFSDMLCNMTARKKLAHILLFFTGQVPPAVYKIHILREWLQISII